MDYDVQWWDEDPVNLVLCLASDIHCLHCYLLFAILVFQNDHFGIPVGCGHVGWYPAEAICAGGQGVGADSLSQVVPVVWGARGCECQHCIYTHALKSVSLSIPHYHSLCMPINPSLPLLFLSFHTCSVSHISTSLTKPLKQLPLALSLSQHLICSPSLSLIRTGVISCADATGGGRNRFQ